MIFGYKPNKMVNRKNLVQNDRGVKYIEIDATNYKSDTKLYLSVASEEYRITPFWIGVSTVEVIFIFLSILEGFSTYMKKTWNTSDEDGNHTGCSKFKYRATFLSNWGNKVAGLFIGIIYMFTFNHVSKFTAMIYLFFLMYPYWMMILLYLGFFKNAVKRFAKMEQITVTFWEYGSNNLTWACEDVELEKEFHNRIVV